ncbi:hypothetical protein ABSA28_01204 [Candidatus Hepatincolaceae symbiont of Richtersius coronifer]
MSINNFGNYVKDNLFSNSLFYSQLIEDLGDEAIAWRLAAEFGGQKIYIPKQIKENHFLYKFGKSFREWVCHNYQCESIVIPCGPTNDINRKSLQIKSLSLRGYSNNQIVRNIGCHYTAVSRVKAKISKDIQLQLELK